MTTTHAMPSVKGLLKTMRILHIAFCVAILVFGLLATTITDNVELMFFDENDNLFYLIPAFAIITQIIGQYVYNRLLIQIKLKFTLIDKLQHYQSAKLIRYAFVEAPCMFAIVGFILSNNLVYLLLAAILLVYLALMKPTKIKIKEELDLNAQQARDLRDALN